MGSLSLPIPVWRALTTALLQSLLALKQVTLYRKFQVGSPRHNIEFQIDLSCLEKLACLPNWLDNSCFSIAILQPMYLLTPHTHSHTHTCLAIQIPLHSSWWCCFYARVSTAVHHTVHIKVWEASLKKSILAMRIKVPSWNVWLAEDRGRNQDH